MSLLRNRLKDDLKNYLIDFDVNIWIVILVVIVLIGLLY
jgi:hypothetical protein